MKLALMLIVILLPFICGTLLQFIPFKTKKLKEIYIFSYVLINSILVFILLLQGTTENKILVYFAGEKLNFALHLDGLGIVFAGLVSALWPLAVLYSFPYMEHEKNGKIHENIFYWFYTSTFGVTLGIAMAGNLLTLYFFYELLTLVTVPLVMHTLSKEAVYASRKYMYYSIGGAAFAFIGMVFIIKYGTTLDFIYGGILNTVAINNKKDLLLLVYIMAFMGFGVKTAIFPFSSWLPTAGVAPTPVTALLHAVAVVKAGAFAVIRLTYYSFGPDFLKGTWAQYFLIIIVVITILYGSSMAVKETHIKRRLAYSTVANLSYILFGVVIMTPLGLLGAITHMIFHGVMKICSFFCAGCVLTQAHATYVYEMNGLAKRMPKVFFCFTISALALMGVPGLCGFVSKWNLVKAAVMSENHLCYTGIIALLISALLTGIYMLSMIVRAYVPGDSFDYSKIEKVSDPDWRMILPLFIFIITMFIFGIHSAPIVDFFTRVAYGMI